MELCLFWSKRTAAESRVGGTLHSLGATTTQRSTVLFARVDSFSVVAVQLSVEPLYEAQGQDQRAAASGNCPIWVSGPAEAGGDTFRVLASYTNKWRWRSAGLWRVCEARLLSLPPEATSVLPWLILCPTGREWAQPHCRSTESRGKSPRRRWRATAAFCRQAPSWRAHCSVSTRDADSPG